MQNWHPGHCAVHYFVFRAERGDTNSYKLRHLCGEGLLEDQSDPMLCAFGCAFFQDPLCESAHYFSSVILVLEWGRLIFHQNRKISFGVTNSNMKTFARYIF